MKMSFKVLVSSSFSGYKVTQWTKFPSERKYKLEKRKLKHRTYFIYNPTSLKNGSAVKNIWTSYKIN